MGLRDAEEMLDVCRIDAARMAVALREIRTRARERLASEHASVTDARHWADVERLATVDAESTGVVLTDQEAAVARILAEEAWPVARTATWRQRTQGLAERLKAPQ